jgi:hypothetical protein
MFEGGKELLNAIGRGDGNLFKQWFRDDPGSAIAGVVAVAVVGLLVAPAVYLQQHPQVLALCGHH